MIVKKRLNRYYRYFCRAVVALFCIAWMVWILNNIFTDESAQIVFGMMVGLGVITAVTTHIVERAFR